MSKQFKTAFAGKDLIFEVGKMAQQATGAVTVRYGDTVVLATAVVTDKPREGANFFPLTVDYEERMYATGKISGSRFIKREGRASEDATLTARFIDRPIRPLFPKGFYNEVQIIVTVLSADMENKPDVISIIAASAALTLAGAPFAGPIAGIRIGEVDGDLVPYPTYEQIANSKLDLIVAGTDESVAMVEAGASELSEERMVEAIELAQKEMKAVVDLQREMAKELGIKIMEPELLAADDEMIAKVAGLVEGGLAEAVQIKDKHDSYEKIAELRDKVESEFLTEESDNPKGESSTTDKLKLSEAFDETLAKVVRRNILEDEKRADGRALNEIRPLAIEIGTLPRPHGSALFSRGETQALSVVTLGSLDDEQLIDTMEQDSTRRYMHHYNFPPYSTGEAKFLRSVGRREIGHGALAERALRPMIPSREEFPYTIRVVSEILSSNGSSSMASVCGSSLSLMHAGVPIKKPVAGIAMGLITDKDNHKILTDIAGMEDHTGDMDFKVAGTREGITALQMDIKVTGITSQIMRDALAQAREARLFLLDEMAKIIAEPNKELSPYAPRVFTVKIDPERIGELIGPGGKVINGIIDRFGGKEVLNINIEDDGMVMVTSVDSEKAQAAVKVVNDMMRVVGPGEVFDGTVTRLMDFGAFVEYLPGREGLVHISKMADHRVEKVSDVVKEGDKVKVVVSEIDDQGRTNLSMKDVKQG